MEKEQLLELKDLMKQWKSLIKDVADLKYTIFQCRDLGREVPPKILAIYETQLEEAERQLEEFEQELMSNYEFARVSEKHEETQLTPIEEMVQEAETNEKNKYDDWYNNPVFGSLH